MDLIRLIFRREAFGTRYPIFPTLRPICLWDILPKALRDEVFLGFTADGCFLVSYVFKCEVFKLTFWLIPGDNGSPSTWLDKPFAVFSASVATVRIHEQIGVRFLQSIADPRAFVIIYSLVSRMVCFVFSVLVNSLFIRCFQGMDYISVVWGTLPEPSCASCRRACELIGTRTRFACSEHFQLLLLSPDCSFSVRECSNWSADITCGSSDCLDQELQIPSFCQNTADKPKSKEHVCSCMTDLTGSLHPSVCPQTGRLRVAWVSQGRQIRLISCSFGSHSPCIVPMVFPQINFFKTLLGLFHRSQKVFKR